MRANRRQCRLHRTAADAERVNDFNDLVRRRAIVTTILRPKSLITPSKNSRRSRIVQIQRRRAANAGTGAGANGSAR